jgi:hypothetical protein
LILCLFDRRKVGLAVGFDLVAMRATQGQVASSELLAVKTDPPAPFHSVMRVTHWSDAVEFQLSPLLTAINAVTA